MRDKTSVRVFPCALMSLVVVFATISAPVVAATPAIDTSTRPTTTQPLLSPAPRINTVDCPLAAAGNAKAEKIVLPTKTQEHDRTCLISVSEALRLRLKPKVQFVDVRAPADYQQVHIPESINIPLHLVKTKPFLKNLQVMLIDVGRSSVELEAQCDELKKLGFKQVTVLDGGLQAWQAKQQPLLGDAVAQARLNRMSAAELFSERLYTGWLVVDVSVKGASKETRQWLPSNTVSIQKKSAQAQIAGIREKVLQARQKNPQLKVLITADNNEAYDWIEKQLTKSGLKDLLYLDGGLSGYQGFFTQQLAIWTQQNQPKRFPSCRG